MAPDQRGYGDTDYKNDTEKYISKFSVLNLTKDIFFLLKNLNIQRVNIIGHDFGSYISYYFSLLHPTMVESLITMSMPFGGAPSNKSLVNTNDINTLNKNLLKLKPPRKHYQKYFASKCAVNNIENCNQGIFKFLKGYFYYKSKDYKKNKPHKLSSFSASGLSVMPEYYVMRRHLGMAETVEKASPVSNYQLSWITDKELRIYANSFKKRGICDPLKWYKVMISSVEKKRIIELNLPRTIRTPSLFIAGDADWGPYQKPQELERMSNFFLKNFHGIKIIKDAGHWVQQENYKDCCKEILNFYKNNNIV